MNDTTDTTDTPSVVERTRKVDVGGQIFAAHFIGDTAVFVLGEETLVFADKDSSRRVDVHGGAILDSASDGMRIVTAGDDGKVVATDITGKSETIATDPKRRWIDHIALGPDGAVAWSAGKQAFVRAGKRAGEPVSMEAPSSIGGLAFAPKGFRLAIAHYSAVTLWFPNASGAKPDVLEWKGSHLGVIFSPDGKFLVTSMQEPTLHGWRLADTKHMRMSGYAAKVRSMNWTHDAKWLATSGSTQLILWPFSGKDGPMGKQPKMLATSKNRVVAVASHPRQDIVAVGYDDGLVLLVRIGDGAEILARKPAGAAVSALIWNAKGSTLAIGTDDGDAGVLDLA
ncbi:MAG TPA: WD40 repeat domain-containing protein [Xanthobacteraceae bacterium]|nr:WD40 repeat domain-containing protein [Xanthobacteraceae bacterium]